MKFPIDFWIETQNKLTFVLSKNLPKKIKMTAVKCVIFRGNKILMTKVPRGWDIPTGHIEKGETPEEAIKREVMEETGTVLKKFHLLGYLHSVKVKENEKNKKYPKISAIPVFVADKFTVQKKFEKLLEATDRKFFKISKDGLVESQNHSFLMKMIFSYVLSGLN
ncbi:MAG: NUDIX domain-containing protein [Candidatus Parcubacteria bacterium]|nr:NUDIX domain-containing protein [Candidatus Parcubacteria bacterium]